MKEQWLKLAAKFDALSQRERLLVMASVVVLLAAVLNTLLLDPVNRHIKELSAQLATDQTQISMVKQQLQVLESTPVVDPDVQNQRRLGALNDKLQGVNHHLDALQKELVSPDRMAGLLEDILKKNGQLKLVSLKTLPVGGSAAPPLNNGAKPSTPLPTELSVYRHGVELTVQGSYFDLMNYLAALEKMPWHVLWGSIKLTTEAYPQSTVTLTIYTLSLDQAWLSL